VPTVNLNVNAKAWPKLLATLVCEPGKTETYYWDATLPRFGVRCRENGSRTWWCQYRDKQTGETRKHPLGDPAHVPQAEARDEAEKLLAAVKLGRDPVGEAAAKKAEAKAAIKLSELVERYLAHQQRRLKPRSFEELQRHLRKHTKPLHNQPAGKVTKRAVVELLEDVATRGAIGANRTRAALSGMFSWGMKAGLITANPVASTFKPAEERSRDRVLTDDELRLIWHATGSGSDHDKITRLLMLTGARREEIGGMCWSELTLREDGTAVWVLPADRSKNHRSHELTLPAMAVALLPTRRDQRALVFGEGAGSFSGWSQCKTRLDQRIAKNAGKPIAAWVLHDLRRTFVSRINDLGLAEPHIIEALVNHQGGVGRAGVAGVYNRSAYADQKREALARWCNYFEQLTGDGGETTPNNVVPLRRRRV
jgi:integrase